MANNLKTKVITGIVRLSYEHVWEPASINGGEPKYSASLIIPKSDKKTVKAIEEAVEAAITEGIGKFGGKKPNKAALKLPLRDGDTEREDEAFIVQSSSPKILSSKKKVQYSFIPFVLSHFLISLIFVLG